MNREPQEHEAELGDAMLESAQTIHFIPNNGSVEWGLHDLVQMKVGTIVNGHLRVRDSDGEHYIEGTITVMEEGLMFDETEANTHTQTN